MEGLTENQAKEFHDQFRLGTWVFGAVAVIAHLLVWSWQPWF